MGSSSADNGFRGAVDSLRIYSDARTSTEILNDVRAIFPGYVPAPDVPPDDAPSPPEVPDPILALQMAVHDNSGLPVQDRHALPNGDLRNSSPIAPAESANPAGMTSVSAAYAAYDVASEGLSNRPEADGLAMSTGTGYVYFADAGSALEQALATSETFAVLTRIRRNTDTGQFEFIIGRPDATDPNGAWSIGINTSDHIVMTLGGVTFDTGVQFGAGQWHEVGLSYTGDDSGSSWAYAYVDGKRKGAFLPGAIGSGQVLYLGSGLMRRESLQRIV